MNHEHPSRSQSCHTTVSVIVGDMDLANLRIVALSAMRGQGPMRCHDDRNIQQALNCGSFQGHPTVMDNSPLNFF
jgi:hypothetical protein